MMSTPAVPFVTVAVILLVGLACKVAGRGGPARFAVCMCLAGLLAATLAQLFTGAIDRGTGVAHLRETLAALPPPV